LDLAIFRSGERIIAPGWMILRLQGQLQSLTGPSDMGASFQTPRHKCLARRKPPAFARNEHPQGTVPERPDPDENKPPAVHACRQSNRRQACAQPNYGKEAGYDSSSSLRSMFGLHD